jgi:hypothetical protein
VNGLRIRAASAWDSLRPPRLSGASGRPLNFPVRRRSLRCTTLLHGSYSFDLDSLGPYYRSTLIASAVGS